MLLFEAPCGDEKNQGHDEGMLPHKKNNFFPYAINSLHIEYWLALLAPSFLSPTHNIT